MEWLPAYWGEIKPTKWAPLFAAPPDLLVVHSAISGNWPAECLHNMPECRPGVVAAAHVSWYEGRVGKLLPGTPPPQVPGSFVQQMSLRRAAPGAGGSVCQGRGGVNARAYHLELPARPPDVEALQGAFRHVVVDLIQCVPSVVYWTTHKEIDPQHKRDPVMTTGFTQHWMDCLGLTWAPREG